MYRILDNLEWANGQTLKAGAVDSLTGLSKKAIKFLLERGVICEVKSPPLAVIPGWEKRAKVFQECGIVTVSDLLDADVVKVSEELGISEEKLMGTIREARQWIE